MVEHHVETGAGVTVAAIPVPHEQGPEFGVIEADDDGKILDFHEKSPSPPTMPGDDTACSPRWATTCSTPRRSSTSSRRRLVQPRGQGPRRRRHPRAHVERRGPPLRLLDQRHPRPGGARAGLLARRRDARCLLRGQHGPARRRCRRSASTTPSGRCTACSSRCRRPSSATAATAPPPASTTACSAPARSSPAGGRALDHRPGRAHRRPAPRSPSRSCCPASGSGPGARLHRCIIDKNVHVPAGLPAGRRRRRRPRPQFARSDQRHRRRREGPGARLARPSRAQHLASRLDGLRLPGRLRRR